MLLPEAVLQRMELAILLKPLDGENLVTIGLYGQHGARFHRMSVENDGARTAQAGLTSDMGTGEAQDISQVMHQQEPRLNVIRTRLAIHSNRHCLCHSV